MTSAAEGIAALERAFASVPRPPNEELLHPQCADDSDLKGLYPFERWGDVPDDVIEEEYAALSFLSAAGYRCFLPAYLRFALRHSHGGAAAVDSTIWSLLPEMYEGDLIQFARSKYELLGPAERGAIEVALEALAAVGHPDAARALSSWRSSGDAPHVPR